MAARTGLRQSMLSCSFHGPCEIVKGNLVCCSFSLDEQLISVCVYVYEIPCTSLYMCALTLGVYVYIMLPIFLWKV